MKSLFCHQKSFLFARNISTSFSSAVRRCSSAAISQNENNVSTTATTNESNKIKKPRHTKQNVKYEKKNIYEAIDLIKELSWAKFDETIEMAVNLGVDPRKPNQSVKGVASLPSGTGKTVRIAVFATGQDAQIALEAGASVVGAEDLVTRIQGGDIPFDRVIATPEMMPLVSKIGKILGPRGMMPNPKLGTVTKDVAKAIKKEKAGSVQFRVEKKGIIQAGIGKISFTKEALLENIRYFMVAISDVKPEGYKGKYLVSASLSSSMGPGIGLDLPNVDPSNPKFMLHPDSFASISK